MESYTNSYAQSYNSSSTDQYRYSFFQFQQDQAQYPPPLSYRAARKFPARNLITKQPIAPLPPTPPKIYKVDPEDFKDVVQKLTGLQEFLPTRLQEVAPPPLNLAPPLLVDYSGKSVKSVHENSVFGALSPLGFSLSPASIAWCSNVLMSPGTLASLEPSAVV